MKIDEGRGSTKMEINTKIFLVIKLIQWRTRIMLRIWLNSLCFFKCELGNVEGCGINKEIGEDRKSGQCRSSNTSWIYISHITDYRWRLYLILRQIKISFYYHFISQKYLIIYKYINASEIIANIVHQFLIYECLQRIGIM